jgi:hypothetical protein
MDAVSLQPPLSPWPIRPVFTAGVEGTDDVV